MSELNGESVRLYIFSGVRNSRWKLLQRFGALRLALPKMESIGFARAMGCGQGIGFSLLPDLSRYTILVTGLDHSLDTFETGPEMRALGNESLSLEIFDLLPLRGHGAWDGSQPFTAGEAPAPDAPLAVITRARIPVRAIPAFLRHSHHVTSELASASGRIFSIGMGELPIVRQATFSVWTNVEAMSGFAYGSANHRRAVNQTRAKSLFGEELFWRFAVRGYTKRALT